MAETGSAPQQAEDARALDVWRDTTKVARGAIWLDYLVVPPVLAALFALCVAKACGL